MILVTGGAGFIGANFVLDWLDASDEPVLNLDKLTYAGNLRTLKSQQGQSEACLRACRHLRSGALDALFAEHKPRAVLHFAAESHVDRSIHGPARFRADQRRGHVHAARSGARSTGTRWTKRRQGAFRFLHVSTDEVFGSLSADDPPFSETTPTRRTARTRRPRRPDHLVRAYHHTYGLPTLTTNCSNNYGPYQFPEKLIPLMIANALAGKPLPVYGDGRTCATGCTWATTAARSAKCWRAAAGRDLQRRRLEREDQPRRRAYAVRPARRTAARRRRARTASRSRM
jgi:dTDP-glucose 4,6-dehydratase